MNDSQLQIVILGLSVTSSWGNGHATTFRGLVRGLDGRGHDVLFLERDVPWYAENRDLPSLPYGRVELYSTVSDLKDRFAHEVCAADLVIVGSYVPEGVAVGEWVTGIAQGVTAFYDIDTPVTLAKLESGDREYLSPELATRYDLYLSFTAGPALEYLERRYGVARARVLYCSVDPALYYPEERRRDWNLGYLGTYSADRQPQLEKLMLEPARRWSAGRFAVAGPLYPDTIDWPENVERIVHLSPPEHRAFYNAQQFTLNITRRDMIRCGYSPSVRLFEAAACATPIISDYWQGLETIFAVGTEILVARSAEETLMYLHDIPAEEREAIGLRAHDRVLGRHTAAHRAAEVEGYALELLANRDHALYRTGV